jgi:hypothetical protein
MTARAEFSQYRVRSARKRHSGRWKANQCSCLAVQSKRRKGEANDPQIRQALVRHWTASAASNRDSEQKESEMFAFFFTRKKTQKKSEASANKPDSSSASEKHPVTVDEGLAPQEGLVEEPKVEEFVNHPFFIP